MRGLPRKTNSLVGFSAPLKDNGFSDLDVFIARTAEDWLSSPLRLFFFGTNSKYTSIDVNNRLNFVALKLCKETAPWNREALTQTWRQEKIDERVKQDGWCKLIVFKNSREKRRLQRGVWW